MIRTGLALLALFAVAQANLFCYECSWPDDGNSCKDGIVEYEEPIECSMDATHCVVTTHKRGNTVEIVDRGCLGGGSKVGDGCEIVDGVESCTTICTDRDGCNAPKPTDPPTTPTTPATTTVTTRTTTTASGAADVTVSRLVILVAGALTAMLCLKL